MIIKITNIAAINHTVSGGFCYCWNNFMKIASSSRISTEVGCAEWCCNEYQAVGWLLGAPGDHNFKRCDKTL